VGDKLPEKQLSLGYQMQSLFVGAGILLANASIFLFQDWFGGGEEIVGAVPKWLYYSFFIGSFLSLATILWSVLKTPEIPPEPEEMEVIRRHRALPFAARVKVPFLEIRDAVKEMPQFMWKLAAVYLFQWYALFVYWQYITPMFRTTMGFDTSEAAAQAAKMSTTYNIVTAVVALVLVPLTLRFGGKKVYASSLFGMAIALFTIPYITDPIYVLLPMILFGIGWASMMGIPYSMVSKIVPQERRGVYMGILNMMIVIPMGIETLSFGPIFKNLLGANSVNAILFAGAFFLISSLLALRLNVSKARTEMIESPE
jgi:maltose/moltooligosaccharide transporter